MQRDNPLVYRLAMDLGSTSLGWAVFRLDAEGSPSAIIKAGARIFSDGRNPKDGSSLAVTRRAARAMRRRRDRLLKRRARMLAALERNGFFPHEESARKALEKLNPFQLRGQGLETPLKPEEFGRALFHLNQRRGFQSNRKTDLFRVLNAEEIGMGLTESLAMTPAASVSGFYIGHPDAVYFNVGKIGEDQLHDMAQRRGMDEKVLERLLAPNL